MTAYWYSWRCGLGGAGRGGGRRSPSRRERRLTCWRRRRPTPRRIQAARRSSGSTSSRWSWRRTGGCSRWSTSRGLWRTYLPRPRRGLDLRAALRTKSIVCPSPDSFAWHVRPRAIVVGAQNDRGRRRVRAGAPDLQQLPGGGAGAAALLEGGDDVAGDGLHVDLVGAVGQAGGAGAAHHLLQGRIGGVAEGAVDLDGAVDDAPEGVGDVDLGHGDLLAEGEPVFDLVGGVEDHELAGVELHSGVRHHPLDRLLLGQVGAGGVALEGAVHEHLQGALGGADPAHAVGEAGGAEAVLAQAVAVAAAAEHVLRRHADVRDAHLRVVGRAGHRLHVADDLPALGWGVDEEGGVAGLWRVCIGVSAGYDDGEAGAVGAGGEPLVAVEHPLVAVLDGRGLDQGGVGAGDLRLGHREAGAAEAIGQGAEVLLLLLGGAPVEERVHVTLVRGLGVDHEGANSGAAGLRGHERHRHGAEAHAAPLRRQVGVPQPLRARLLTELDYRLDVGVAVSLLFA